MKYKAILFDLDGTLLNTLDDLGDSMNNVLSKLNYPTHPIDAYKYFVGDGLEMLVKRALPEGYDTVVFERAYNLMRAEYEKNCENKTGVYAGIAELLEFLQEKGIKRTVLTNKPHDTAQKVIEKYFPKYNFDIVLGARDNVPKKPNPEAAFEIAEKLNLKCSEFLYLGDTKVDMQTASSAGMFPIGVLWGFRKADELIESGAKILITHPANLKEFFNV
jgi:phosphoglycolate phosphatase